MTLIFQWYLLWFRLFSSFNSKAGLFRSQLSQHAFLLLRVLLQHFIYKNAPFNRSRPISFSIFNKHQTPRTLPCVRAWTLDRFLPRSLSSLNCSPRAATQCVWGWCSQCLLLSPERSRCSLIFYTAGTCTGKTKVVWVGETTSSHVSQSSQV